MLPLQQHGNLVASFSDETEARAVLQRIVEAEPDAVEDVALFIADDAGAIVEGPIHAPTNERPSRGRVARFASLSARQLG